MSDVTRRLLLSPITFAARLPRGLVSITGRVGRWAADSAYAPVLARARNEEKGKEIERQRKVRADRIRGRFMLMASVVSSLVLVQLWLWPQLWQGLAAVLVLAALLDGGRKTKTGQAVVVKDSSAGPVTPDGIVTAFTQAMQPVARAVQADPKALALLGPVHRDGPGWAATVELPGGVTTTDCVRARESLASGLKVAGDQLGISPGRHAGQVKLWVADVPPSELPPVEWAYAGQDRCSLIDPVPIGVTAKGTPVSLSLRTQSPDGRTIAGGSLLVGGVSGSGKTTLMRLVVSAAALDPTSTIAIFDGKGDGDYAAFRPVCDWMRVGDSPDDMADLHAMLEAAQAEMAKRQKGLAPRTPLLIVIDEVQRVKDKDILALIEDLLRRGRSSGIFVVLATQKPSAESLPTDLRDSVRSRVCMKVHNQATNDMILGTGAYTEGRDATKLTRGIGLLLDVDTDAVDMVRVANVTDDIARSIAEAHPRTPGRIFAQAVGAGPTIVERVLEVWPAGADRASSAELAVALSGLGGEFTGWRAADVTRALQEAGVDVPAKVRFGERTARGVFRAALEGVPV